MVNLEEWRARQKEGESLTLPSGLDVRLKKVMILDLVQQGKIPSTIRAQVDKMLKQGSTKGDVMSLEGFEKYSEAVAEVCRACLVAPKELTVDELPWTDKLAIWEWANAPAKKLATFRTEPRESVDVALAGGDVRAETEQLVGAGAE